MDYVCWGLGLFGLVGWVCFGLYYCKYVYVYNLVVNVCEELDIDCFK